MSVEWASFNVASNTCAYTLLKGRGGMLPRSSSNEFSVIRSLKTFWMCLKSVRTVLTMDVDTRSEHGQNICTHSQPQMLIYAEHCPLKSTQKYTLVQFTKLFVLVAVGSLNFLSSDNHVCDFHPLIILKLWFWQELFVSWSIFPFCQLNWWFASAN